MEELTHFASTVSPVFNVFFTLLILAGVLFAREIKAFLTKRNGDAVKEPPLTKGDVREIVNESEWRINQKFDDMAASLKKDLAAHDQQNEQDFRQIRQEINQINQNLINGKK